MPCECLLLTRLLMFVDRDGDTPLHWLMRNQSLTLDLKLLHSALHVYSKGMVKANK